MSDNVKLALAFVLGAAAAYGAAYFIHKPKVVVAIKAAEAPAAEAKK